MSLKYKGKEIISQTKQAESFGSTFWTSPQKEWNWPPVPEFDKNPYQVEERDGRLIMTSEVSPRMKYRIRKEFAADDTQGRHRRHLFYYQRERRDTPGGSVGDYPCGERWWCHLLRCPF